MCRILQIKYMNLIYNLLCIPCSYVQEQEPEKVNLKKTEPKLPPKPEVGCLDWSNGRILFAKPFSHHKNAA